MKTEFSYQKDYVLDKAHFEECFGETSLSNVLLNRYYKAMTLMIIGLLLLLVSQTNAYLGWFFIGLGIVDALSIYYQKPWWVTRQMLSRASGSKVQLTIDDKGIHNQSHYVNQLITWSQISDIQPTDQGLVIICGKHKSYLSNSLLSDEALEFIMSKFNNQSNNELS